MARKEPLPDETKDHTPPHYLMLPSQSSVCVQRNVVDPKGAKEPKGSKLKPAEIPYRFFKNKATPVHKDSHADFLLKNLSGTGIIEVAYEELEPIKKDYHPQYTDKIRRGDYNEEAEATVTRRRFRPVMDEVVRTGKEVENGDMVGIKPRQASSNSSGEDPLEELYVEDLKEVLRGLDKPVSGNKDELIERVRVNVSDDEIPGIIEEYKED